MTSHLLFIGYSMANQDFGPAAQRVKTVRALVSMSETSLGSGSGATARDLPRPCLLYGDHAGNRLGPVPPAPRRQGSLIEDHSKIRLREMLCTLVHLLDTEDPVCKNSAWNHVED